LIAYRFPNHENRGNYLALAFTGFGLGVLIGPPFGSIVYEFCGKHTPFYILAGIGVFDGIFQMMTYNNDDSEIGTMKEGSSLLSLLADPYITLTAITMASANICIAFVEVNICSTE
jgi:DHA1 family solute carrier family 18 vesicular amine transporter 1/2